MTVSSIFLRLLVVLVLLWGSAPAAIAQEHQEFYQGARSLGMGGASVAAVNDETALLLNPAGLGRLRNFIFTFFDPEVEVGMTTGRIGTQSASNLYTVEPLVEYLQAKPDMTYRGKVQVFPSLVVPNFGAGMLVKKELSAVSSSDGSAVHVDYIEDWAPALGYSTEFWGGILRVGVTGRYVSRKEFHGDLPGSHPELTLDALSTAGTGVGLDAGVLLTAPVQMLPTLGFVARDVSTTTYSMGGGFFKASENGAPTPSPEVWDVGLSLNPIHSNYTRSVIALEYRGINLPLQEGEKHLRRFHVGWEYNVYDQLFFRAGMNQKYWTAGFELATSWYQLQLATYGEEVGTLPHSKEDRRVLGKVAFRL